MILNIKKLRDIMRNDAGVNGDAQRMEQIAWILFLKLYDLFEKNWKTEAILEGKSYKSVIAPELSWDAWAAHKTIEGKIKGELLTSQNLLDFVNSTLFPTLKSLNFPKTAPAHQKIIQSAFEDANNYMKNGTALRELINEIDNLKIEQMSDRKELSNIYESFLKILQSAGSAGEFYTPRAVTDFAIKILEPKIGEKIADLACGTGGFLVSAYHFLESQIQKGENISVLNSQFYGTEKKQLPYILAVTGFLINGIEEPNLTHENAFDTPFVNLDDLEKFDIIAMNPPYGGHETNSVSQSFPKAFQSSETADLFMAVITERLANNGRAAVVLPDGFLFGNDTAKINLKKRLLSEFNLHLIVRLPKGVFAPYTSITTNILFFNRDPLGTREIAFYRLDMPENIKSFGKTKSMELAHFEPFFEWNKTRETLTDESGNFKAKTFTRAELESRGYNFDLCGFVSSEEEILPPQELMSQIQAERNRLNATLEGIMSEIAKIIDENK